MAPTVDVVEQSQTSAETVIIAHDFDEALDAQYECVKRSVTKQPLNRETLLGILNFCRIQRHLSDVEDEVLGSNSFPDVMQSPYGLMMQMVRVGGLERTEIDANGNPLTDENTSGMTDDEIEDLVADELFQTTHAGAKVADFFEPQARMDRLLGVHPEGRRAFSQLLAFCDTTRPRSEVESFIRESGLLGQIHVETGARPSVFVDKLERAGMLMWRNHGWCISDAGRRYLKEYEG